MLSSSSEPAAPAARDAWCCARRPRASAQRDDDDPGANNDRPRSRAARRPGQMRASMLGLLPSRFFSRVWGVANSMPLHPVLREPVYRTWSWMFGCKLDEVDVPLHSFRNLREFFTRHVRPGVHNVEDDVDAMVSPVDGAVTSVSVDLDRTGMLEQVKGIDFAARDLLGFEPPRPRKGHRLFSAVFYLSPGDYHRFHSPTEWVVQERRHIWGQLLPVNNMWARMMPSLFCVNERVVLNGIWQHGFYSYTAVGAYNVGSIVIDFDNELVTNRTRLPRPLIGARAHKHRGSSSASSASASSSASSSSATAGAAAAPSSSSASDSSASTVPASASSTTAAEKTSGALSVNDAGSEEDSRAEADASDAESDGGSSAHADSASDSEFSYYSGSSGSTSSHHGHHRHHRHHRHRKPRSFAAFVAAAASTGTPVPVPEDDHPDSAATSTGGPSLLSGGARALSALGALGARAGLAALITPTGKASSSSSSSSSSQRINARSFVSPATRRASAIATAPELSEADARAADIATSLRDNVIDGVPLRRGDHIGKFNLGSTIVLVFEAPKEFQFEIEATDRVRMGGLIGFVPESSPFSIRALEAAAEAREDEDEEAADAGAEGESGTPVAEESEEPRTASAAASGAAATAKGAMLSSRRRRQMAAETGNDTDADADADADDADEPTLAWASGGRSSRKRARAREPRGAPARASTPSRSAGKRVVRRRSNEDSDLEDAIRASLADASLADAIADPSDGGFGARLVGSARSERRARSSGVGSR